MAIMPKNSLLIIDDDVAMRETLSDIFQEKGYSTAMAGTGHEAIDKARQRAFDAAMIDIKLPDMDGTVLLREFTKDYPEMICIIVTGHASLQNAIRALKEGARGYFLKPLVIEEVILRIEEVLDKQRLQQELRESGARNRELEEINARLHKIVESTREFTSCNSLEQLGPLLLEEFGRNMEAEGGSLFLREGDSLVLVNSLDPGHTPATIAFPLQKGSVFERAMTKREAVLIQDIEKENDVHSSGWKGYKDGYILIFPLPDETGKIVGIISLHNKISPPFTPQDRELGTILTSYSSETLRAARAVEALQQAYNEMEEKVKERTRELEDKNRELERFNKLFIDREFRIKELRERVKEFEKD